MKREGCLINTLILGAGLFAGYHLGAKFVKQNTSTEKYEIVDANNNYFLRSKELNKTIKLREINNNVLGGDLEHLIKGAKLLKDKEFKEKYLGRDLYE